jgi:hypothetical protein
MGFLMTCPTNYPFNIGPQQIISCKSLPGKYWDVDNGRQQILVTCNGNKTFSVPAGGSTNCMVFEPIGIQCNATNANCNGQLTLVVAIDEINTTIPE